MHAGWLDLKFIYSTVLSGLIYGETVTVERLNTTSKYCTFFVPFRNYNRGNLDTHFSGLVDVISVESLIANVDNCVDFIEYNQSYDLRKFSYIKILL